MDPNQTLEDLMFEIAKAKNDRQEADLDAIIESFESLHDWMCAGGAIPRLWLKSRGLYEERFNRLLNICDDLERNAMNLTVSTVEQGTLRANEMKTSVQKYRDFMRMVAFGQDI